jgi:hypothetical protein
MHFFSEAHLRELLAGWQQVQPVLVLIPRYKTGEPFKRFWRGTARRRVPAGNDAGSGRLTALPAGTTARASAGRVAVRSGTGYQGSPPAHLPDISVSRPTPVAAAQASGRSGSTRPDRVHMRLAGPAAVRCARPTFAESNWPQDGSWPAALAAAKLLSQPASRLTSSVHESCTSSSSIR